MRFKPALLLAGAALIAATAAQAKSDRSLPAEERIAHALEGRTPGKAVDCLRQRDIRSTRIIDGTAILYETLGGTIYLNRLRSGGAFLHDGLTLVTDTHSDELCSIDIVRLYDTTSRMQMGSIGLGEFVPYARPPRESR